MLQKLKKSLLTGFLSSRCLLPAHCLICFSGLTNKHFICPSCYQALAKNTPACSQCAEPLTGYTSLTQCPACIKNPPAFNQVTAPWLYSPPFSQLVWEFKYQHNLLAGYFILELLHQELSRHPNSYQLLTVVPGQKQRIRQRGLHAPTWLAVRLSLLTNLPFKPQALTRIKNLTSQQTLTKRARWLNPKGAFKANSQLVANKNLLLLDDVLTTGASCHWAAKELINQGAANVDVLVTARTPKK